VVEGLPIISAPWIQEGGGGRGGRRRKKKRGKRRTRKRKEKEEEGEGRGGGGGKKKNICNSIIRETSQLKDGKDLKRLFLNDILNGK
jgi:hypothetical protein